MFEVAVNVIPVAFAMVIFLLVPPSLINNSYAPSGEVNAVSSLIFFVAIILYPIVISKRR